MKPTHGLLDGAPYEPSYDTDIRRLFRRVIAARLIAKVKDERQHAAHISRNLDILRRAVRIPVDEDSTHDNGA